ncbi:MAG: hypothetical protein MUP82_09935 [Candidatus Marinimicrobia bacterium]|nr:hypothetical protein [Candidatus Neomarinimicrobiota bacterium]
MLVIAIIAIVVKLIQGK